MKNHVLELLESLEIIHPLFFQGNATFNFNVKARLAWSVIGEKALQAFFKEFFIEVLVFCYKLVQIQKLEGTRALELRKL